MDIARHLGISRARVTQTLNLLKLPPETQKLILALPHEEAASITEPRLRPLSQVSSPVAQRVAFRDLAYVPNPPSPPSHPSRFAQGT